MVGVWGSAVGRWKGPGLARYHWAITRAGLWMPGRKGGIAFPGDVPHVALVFLARSSGKTGGRGCSWVGSDLRIAWKGDATGGAGVVVDVTGPFVQSAGGSLDVRIAGLDPTQIGRIKVTGTVTVAGAFAGHTDQGFTLTEGDRAQFISATGSVSGTFSPVGQLPDATPGDKTILIYDAKGISLAGTDLADINNDGKLDLFDFLAFTNLFNNKDPAADLTHDGTWDLFDFLAFVNLFNDG